MFLIGSHLFLRGDEVCNLLLRDIYVRKIVFEDGTLDVRYEEERRCFDQFSNITRRFVPKIVCYT